MKELQAKADVLLEALPYLQRYRGQTIVIKYGGSFMDSPDAEVRLGVARDIVFLEAVGINPVVVHGGGKAISRAMEKAGLQPVFIQGQRITDKATVDVVEQVLSHEINPEIVATLEKLGARAKGFAGSTVFHAEKLWLTSGAEKIDLGFVGQITDVKIEPIAKSLRDEIIPVISPTARDAEGNNYNCNADIAAAKTAAVLKAERLIFMSDVPGLLRDPKDPSTLIHHLDTAEVPELKRRGVIDKGMIPKIDSAVNALKAGVKKVSLVDGRVPHSVLLELFTDVGQGTEIVL